MKLGHEIHYDEGEIPESELVVLPRKIFNRSMAIIAASEKKEEVFALGRKLTKLMYDWDKENNPKGVFGNPFAPWVYRLYPPVGGGS